MSYHQNSVFHYSIATRARNPYFLDLLKPSEGEKVLDIGCGVGYFMDLLESSSKAEIWGIDISSESVVTAKQYFGDKVMVGSTDHLPFEDNFFSKALCSEVLEHVPDDIAAIKEIKRILKPKGELVVTVPCLDGIFGSKIKNICHGHEGPEKHEREGYRKKEFIKLMESNGFTVEKCFCTMIFYTELLMGISKIAFSVSSGKKNLEHQKDVESLQGTKKLSILKLIFPLLLLGTKIEDFFLKKLPGHMLVAKLRSNPS